MVGADPDDLERGAAELEDHGRRLHRTMRELTERINITPWFGRSGDRFRHQWNASYRHRMEHTAQMLIEAGHDLRHNAEDQRNASRARGGWLPPGVIIFPRPTRPPHSFGGRHPDWLLPPAPWMPLFPPFGWITDPERDRTPRPFGPMRPIGIGGIIDDTWRPPHHHGHLPGIGWHPATVHDRDSWFDVIPDAEVLLPHIELLPHRLMPEDVYRIAPITGPREVPHSGPFWAQPAVLIGSALAGLAAVGAVGSVIRGRRPGAVVASNVSRAITIAVPHLPPPPSTADVGAVPVAHEVAMTEILTEAPAIASDLTISGPEVGTSTILNLGNLTRGAANLAGVPVRSLWAAA